VAHGDGYRFEAPGGWSVKRSSRGTSASRGEVDYVGVSVFRLQKPYRLALFAAATTELDRVAAQLAKQLGGRVASASTVRAGGGDARTYRVELDGRVEEITFVLRGLREYQLLCRRAPDASAAPCRALVRSFVLG
jgi:hypothetical protein